MNSFNSQNDSAAVYIFESIQTVSKDQKFNTFLMNCEVFRQSQNEKESSEKFIPIIPSGMVKLSPTTQPKRL